MICHSPLLWLNIGDAYASLFRIPHCMGWLEIEIAKMQRLDISGGLICLPVRKAPDLSQLQSCSIWKSTLSQNRSSWQKRPQNLLTYPPQTQQNQQDANRQPLWHQGTPSQSSPAWRRCRSWSLCSPFDSHDLNLKLPPDPARYQNPRRRAKVVAAKQQSATSPSKMPQKNHSLTALILKNTADFTQDATKALASAGPWGLIFLQGHFKGIWAIWGYLWISDIIWYPHLRTMMSTKYTDKWSMDFPWRSIQGCVVRFSTKADRSTDGALGALCTDGNTWDHGM